LRGELERFANDENRYFVDVELPISIEDEVIAQIKKACME
jgi:hypothetical protein